MSSSSPESTRFAKWIDSAVATFMPGRALERKIARERLHNFRYTGATSSRDRKATNQNLQSSESSTYARDRIQMMKEARNLEENGEIANSILGKFETHVTGHIGYNPRTGSKKADAKIGEWFTEWMSRADYTERHSLRKMAQIALRQALTDGDCGMATFLNDDGEARVIGIEADRIGDPYDTQPKPNEFSGVLVDGKKAPTGYRVFQRDEFDQLVNPEVVPAKNFCHLSNPNKFDRYRGITSFAPVIDTAVDVMEIVQFEKLAVKWGSMQTGVVVGQPGGPQTNEFFEDGENSSGRGFQTQELQHGMIQYLEGDNASIQQFQTQRPGAAWDGFIQLLIRLYAAGFNLPYGFVFDAASSRGPGARFEAEQADRVFSIWQQLLVEKALDKIKNIALIGAMANGEIPSNRNFMRGAWQFPPAASIDVGRESAADVAEMGAGIKSHKTTLRKYSLNGFDERRQIALETKDWIELSEELDIPLELLMGEKALLGKETEPETQKQANGKGFEREIYYLPKNGDTPAPQVNVRTAPINLNLGKESTPAPKVKKKIELQRKNGKIVGASILEVPENGQATKRSVSLSKDKRARIDGNDIVELPR